MLIFFFEAFASCSPYTNNIIMIMFLLITTLSQRPLSTSQLVVTIYGMDGLIMLIHQLDISKSHRKQQTSTCYTMYMAYIMYMYPTPTWPTSCTCILLQHGQHHVHVSYSNMAYIMYMYPTPTWPTSCT